MVEKLGLNTKDHVTKIGTKQEVLAKEEDDRKIGNGLDLV